MGCNFYEMDLGSAGGVLHIAAEAIVVTFCYFGALSGGNLFSSSNGRKFVVTDCDSDRVSATTRNTFGFGFTLLPLSHYDGCYYPATAPVSSAQSPTVAVNTFPVSHHHTHSD
jgi:hypothetical protein